MDIADRRKMVARGPQPGMCRTFTKDEWPCLNRARRGGRWCASHQPFPNVIPAFYIDYKRDRRAQRRIRAEEAAERAR